MSLDESRQSRLKRLHRILNAGDWRQIVGVPRENGVVSPRDARFVWGNTVELRLKTFSKSWRSPVGHWIRPRGRRSGLRSRFGVETKGNSFRKPQVDKERIGVIGDIWRLKSGGLEWLDHRIRAFQRRTLEDFEDGDLVANFIIRRHFLRGGPSDFLRGPSDETRKDAPSPLSLVLQTREFAMCLRITTPYTSGPWILGNGCNVINSVKCGLESQNKDKKRI